MTIFIMTLKVDNQTWYEHVQLDRHYCHIVAKDLAYKIICENVKIKVFAETGNIRITFEYALRLLKAIIALRLLKAIIFMFTTASIYIYVCVTIHIKFDLN